MNARDYLTLEWYATCNAPHFKCIIVYAPTGKLGKWSLHKKVAQIRGKYLQAMMKRIVGLLWKMNLHLKVSAE